MRIVTFLPIIIRGCVIGAFVDRCPTIDLALKKAGKIASQDETKTISIKIPIEGTVIESDMLSLTEGFELVAVCGTIKSLIR